MDDSLEETPPEETEFETTMCIDGMETGKVVAHLLVRFFDQHHHKLEGYHPQPTEIQVNTGKIDERDVIRLAMQYPKREKEEKSRIIVPNKQLVM